VVLDSDLMDLKTPSLLLDAPRLQKNLQFMGQKLAAADIDLQPHMKTAKSVPIARMATEGHSGAITVSTVKEAEEFAKAGFSKITYAVGLAPHKLGRIAALLQRFPNLTLCLLVDNPGAIAAAAEAGQIFNRTFPLFLEIDSGAQRGGLRSDDPKLLGLAQQIARTQHVSLAGVLTHAGQSYAARNRQELLQIADQERLSAFGAAGLIRGLGLSCPAVSIGSTPTLWAAESFTGATEARPGVYMFMDVFQAQLGCCQIEDIALSVLATVIGRYEKPARLLIDAGALALSQDRSTALQARHPGRLDYGLGMVCDLHGQPFPDLLVAQAHQEHGFIVSRTPETTALPAWPIGYRVRIFPIHACMTAAAYQDYIMIENGAVTGTLPRFNGW